MSYFGWNQDPAVDFCVEVDAIEGLAADYRAGLEPKEAVERRIEEAMKFRVGGVPAAVDAKAALRKLEASLT